MRNSDLLGQTLPEPHRPEFLPKPAQWLAGEGAGSWFYIEKTNAKKTFEITRFSPRGKIECVANFVVENDKNLNLNLPYRFVHLSHCAFVHIKQNQIVFKLTRI